MKDDFDRLPWEPDSEADTVEFEVCPSCQVAGVVIKQKIVCPTCKTLLQNCCGD